MTGRCPPLSCRLGGRQSNRFANAVFRNLSYRYGLSGDGEGSAARRGPEKGIGREKYGRIARSAGIPNHM